MQHMSLGFWPVQEDSDQHDWRKLRLAPHHQSVLPPADLTFNSIRR